MHECACARVRARADIKQKGGLQGLGSRLRVTRTGTQHPATGRRAPPPGLGLLV